MGVYGAFLYGGELYGAAVLLPNSVDWDIYDFCEPTDLTMVALLASPGVTPLRPVGAPHVFWDAANDLHLMSDDGWDSGFWIDYYITSTYTLQFTIVPTALPLDFSSPSSNRVFLGVSNQNGRAVGVLLSANEGIALSTDPTGASYTRIPFTAQLFGESSDYWTFRLTVNPETGLSNLYVTRLDVLTALTKHELIITFDTEDSPAGSLDRTLVSVLGTAARPSEIELDCIRMSSDEKISDPRPIAAIGDDQARAWGTYGFFDARGSYDPDTPPDTVGYWWTLTRAPDGADALVALTGTTPADISGFTHLLSDAVGAYASVRVGDLVRGDDGDSFVLYVSDDASWLALAHKTLTANLATGSWTLIRQSGWGGYRDLALRLAIVLDEVTNPALLLPATGDTYLVGVGAIGAWAGHDGELATWTGAAWSFAILDQGLLLFVLASARIYRTTGTKLWYDAWACPWEVDYYAGRTRALGAVLGSVVGLYTISIVSRVPDRYSTALSRLLSLYADPVPLGLPPEDAGFIWDYLPDFWQLVDDRSRIETVWSGLIQLYSSELVKLWQYETTKCLNDTQRHFRHGWMGYAPLLEEPDYEDSPAEISIVSELSGYAVSPGTTARTYNTGGLPGTVVEGSYLVLGGLAYRIARSNPLIPASPIITYDELPADRPNYWMVRSYLTSQSTNFSSAAVRVGDTAVFEARLVDDIVELEACVWGVRGNVLVFDDTAITPYLASGYTVRFRAVRRRGALSAQESLVDLPRLQEYIDRGLDTADVPLEEGHDFHVESVTTVEAKLVNTIQLYDPWTPVAWRGYYGYTGAVLRDRFLDATATFETTFGPGADLTQYILELVETGARYRLRSVISDTELETFDECLDTSLLDQRYRIRSLGTVPDLLWAEEAFFDNAESVEGFFGILLDFLVDHLEELTEGLDYFNTVRGLWYFVWTARTLWNMEVGAQIILGLPFAEEAGTITDVHVDFEPDITRVLVLGDESGSVKSYRFPSLVGMAEDPETGVPLTTGDHLARFDPVSGGVEIQDYLRDADWWYELYLGGAFHEPEKVHTWCVRASSDIFSLSNLLFLIRFLKLDSRRRQKPHYTDPLFVVEKLLDEDIEVSDHFLLGPVVPDGYTYPDAWDVFAYPYSWTDCPFEVPRVPVSNAPITGWTVPAEPRRPVVFGNLHLYDDPGLVPDQWTGAWPSGAPGAHSATTDEAACMFDALDGLGHCVHRFDDVLGAVPQLSDGDMESPLVPGMPGSPWIPIIGAFPVLMAKGPPAHGGAQSLFVSSVGGDLGIYQDYAGLVDEDLQVGARFWVFMFSGCASFQLIGQDGATVLAEKRASKALLQWQQITLHGWWAGAGASPLRVRITTGPAGGTFCVDDVQSWAGQLPWSSWFGDRAIMGRTGGYTVGGMPDEHHEFMVYGLLP